MSAAPVRSASIVSVCFDVRIEFLCICYPLQKEGILTLRDLKKCKLSGNFFNILFNLNKFVAFETRDPILVRQVWICGVCVRLYTYIGFFVLLVWTKVNQVLLFYFRSVRSQALLSGTDLRTTSTFGCRWKRTAKMPPMGVEKYGMNLLKHLIEVDLLKNVGTSIEMMRYTHVIVTV